MASGHAVPPEPPDYSTGLVAAKVEALHFRVLDCHCERTEAIPPYPREIASGLRPSQ